MFLLKELGILAAGIFIGFTLATLFLYPQIQNRYKMGQNNGFLTGALKVIHFLEDNFSDKGTAPAKAPLSHLDIKNRRIEIFEKDGVRTIRVR